MAVARTVAGLVVVVVVVVLLLVVDVGSLFVPACGFWPVRDPACCRVCGPKFGVCVCGSGVVPVLLFGDGVVLRMDMVEFAVVGVCG